MAFPDPQQPVMASIRAEGIDRGPEKAVAAIMLRYIPLYKIKMPSYIFPSMKEFELLKQLLLYSLDVSKGQMSISMYDHAAPWVHAGDEQRYFLSG